LVPLLSDEDMMMKTSMPVFFDKIRVISLGSDEYSLKGRPIEKIASISEENSERLSYPRAKYYLMLSGLDEPQSEGFLKRADINVSNEVNILGTSTIKTLNDIKGGIDIDPEPIKKLASIMKISKINLIKESADVGDKSIADKVLALNFINPNNIKIFADYLPEFKEISQKLAKLLLASRLGMTAIDEDSTKSAMEKIDGVISQLEMLSQASK